MSVGFSQKNVYKNASGGSSEKHQLSLPEDCNNILGVARMSTKEMHFLHILHHHQTPDGWTQAVDVC